MKSQVWIVVANQSLTKLYLAENVNTLIEVDALKHNEGHLSGKDLVADKGGRVTERMGYGTNTIEEKFPPKKKEALTFAKEIAHYLEEKCHEGKVDKWYLIAPPAFLGVLRQHLGSATSKALVGEVSKDLVHLKPKELREYLPPVL